MIWNRQSRKRLSCTCSSVAVYKGNCEEESAYVGKGQIIVDVAKGIEESTLLTLSAQIEEEIPQADVAVLSGPSHAEEVGRKLPTTCVIGAKTKKTGGIFAVCVY